MVTKLIIVAVLTGMITAATNVDKLFDNAKLNPTIL
mgnify:CR=1 FL=1